MTATKKWKPLRKLVHYLSFLLPLLLNCAVTNLSILLWPLVASIKTGAHPTLWNRFMFDLNFLSYSVYILAAPLFGQKLPLQESHTRETCDICNCSLGVASVAGITKTGLPWNF